MNLKEIQAGIGWLETDIKREDMYISALREFEYQESEVSEAKAHKTALNTALAALRELVEADADGRVVVLPCKPDKAYWHRNYETGQLELNFEMHSMEEHDDTYPEINSCAYWE